ncbi:MAG: metalloprotease TldD [Alphaproteobacteria bacterium]|nr:metalloprotease TldD [Alphaproteobacteria bacterium]
MNKNIANNLLYGSNNSDGLNKEKAQSIVSDTLAGFDDGELFLEYSQSESISLEDGHIKSAAFDNSKGFGLRSVLGELSGYAHSSDISTEALLRAATTVKAVKNGHAENINVSPSAAPDIAGAPLYTDANPLAQIEFEAKVKLLSEIDVYARAKEPLVTQVMASISGTWRVINILRPDGSEALDARPLVRLNVAVIATKGGRMETGSHGMGGRTTYDILIDEKNWKHATDEAIRQALINLDAMDAPAGEMPIVLGSGWPGVMLHEAVGHGLEGDFNRKGTSAFSGKIGQQVAAKGVTVIDDGTIEDRRGSITVDDEGTPSKRNVLIEDGVLKGYMQDRLNAKLMGVEPTGNGRRESYEYAPIPRMTNTFMLAGDKSPDEIISSIDKGIYAVQFSGGQVDITSGKFVFSASEAYMIENGKVGAPIKGATLIGDGPTILNKISMIGNDLELDAGVGTCGKDGQGVPVGVGQPTLKIDAITVGGTQA